MSLRMQVFQGSGTDNQTHDNEEKIHKKPILPRQRNMSHVEHAKMHTLGHLSAKAWRSLMSCRHCILLCCIVLNRLLFTY